MGGMNQIMDYLFQLGHKEIGFIGGFKGAIAFDVKMKSYREKLISQKIDVNENWIIESGYDITKAKKAVDKLFSQKKMPTAIFCINDLIAISVIKEANNLGLRVPEDLSVVGFDNIFLSGNYIPSITTVSHNYQELAKNAVDLMLTCIHNKENSRSIVLKTQLIERNSCKKIS